MSLSNLELATRVRNLVSEKSPAAKNVTIPHIQGLIPTAMELWARMAMDDPKKYDLLNKDFTASLSSGTLDLTPYINGTSGKISLKDLRSSTIYTTINSVRTPFSWVSSQAQLNFARYPNDFPAVFLEGNTLRTRNTDGSQTSLGSASISFTVVNLPSSATDIPTNLVGDFVVFLADLVLKEKLTDGQ